MNDDSKKQSTTKIFYTMDMLRGVAAIAVVGRHLDHVFYSIMPESHLSVDLFFILSGFVIDHAYRKRLESNFTFMSFLKTRIIRLYPLYAIGSIAGILIAAFYLIYENHLSPSIAGRFLINAFSAAICLPLPPQLSLDYVTAYPFNFPAWSLFWEMFINVIYAYTVRKITTPILSWIIAISGIALVIYTLAFQRAPGGTHGHIFLEGVIRVIFPFFTGVGLHRLWSLNFFPAIPIPSWITAIVFIGLISVHIADKPIYEICLILLALPILVIISTQNPNTKLIPIYSAIGSISYAIYAIHAPFALLEIKLYKEIEGISFEYGFALETSFIGLMATASFLINKHVDIPIRKWLSAKLTPKRHDRKIPEFIAESR